jgi:chemosensory pili system protein ChpA (sensor histidine kinase/response regulator)
MANPGYQYELDINTLGWIKGEIDNTLEQAISALKSYKETPNDKSHIQYCLNYLHQIQGTLKMVELYGAAMVIEELEALVDALSKNKITNKDETFQVLINTMTSLPDYLEKIQSGGTDIPVILLPLLNDMRAARSESLLTENALFSPNLDISTPINSLNNQNIQLLAKKLRHSCHIGMLLWFKDQNTNYGINRVSDVMNSLQNACSNTDVHKMLWITSGVMESLREGGLESSIALKLLIGNVDREIKRVIDDGEFKFSNNVPTTLIKNLLYYISCSLTNGALTKEIKQKFKLKSITLDKETYGKLNTYNTTLAASLIQTTSSELIDELAYILENLANFIRSDSKEIEILIQTKISLSKISDTLGLLGLGIQRTTIIEQRQFLISLIDFMSDINNNDIMDIAVSLLNVKDSLTDLNKITTNRFNTDTVRLELRDVEKEKLLNILLNKSNNELYQVKKALSDFSISLNKHDLLIDIPKSLLKIQKRLTDLDLERASKLLKLCSQYIQNDLIVKKEIPMVSSLDLLADAISSIEFYLESLVENWGQSDSILFFAEQSLEEYELIKCAIPNTLNNGLNYITAQG